MLIFKSYVIYITFLYLYKSLCSILWNRLNRSFDFDPCSHVGNNTDRKTITTCHSYFNPRSHVGNDIFTMVFQRQPQRFNPRSRVGNDISTIIHCMTLCTFQSTFPRGERLTSITAIFSNVLFQSTFPRGERQGFLLYYCSVTKISIHVPAWGTTM